MKVEDLQVRNMVKNHHFAKSVSDAGWIQVRRFLEYKAACAGKRVVAIPPHYNTNQLRSRCGVYVQKSLLVRTPICPECDLVLDRDHNDALNVLQVGLKLDQHSRAEEKQAEARPSGGT
ncbi:MAG TPA: zinc ribbon domain-containing protein [Ktedonobacterales bacterium]|nr:zinc ribbon domain-containing protein [Ktedonobacterales bacterium]